MINLYIRNIQSITKPIGVRVLNNTDKLKKSSDNKNSCDYYDKSPVCETANVYNKPSSTVLLQSRKKDGIDLCFNEATGKYYESYNGIACEEYIKNLTPETDSFTGIKYYFIGRETYIPQDQKDLFEQRIASKLKSANLEDNPFNWDEMVFKSDISRNMKLPDGSILTKDTQKRKISIELLDERLELHNIDASLFAEKLYDSLFDIVSKKDTDSKEQIKSFWKDIKENNQNII